MKDEKMKVKAILFDLDGTIFDILKGMPLHATKH